MKSAHRAFVSCGSLRHKGQPIAHPKHHQGSTFQLASAKVASFPKTTKKKAE